MICPFCKQELIENKKNWICVNGHNFDKSKYGYVNLLVNRSHAGDNKDMVKARLRVMEKGYFSKLADTICELIKKYKISSLLDVGCGEGYYDDLINKKTNISVYGIDISKDACLYAAKRNQDNKYIVSSVTELPFADKSFSCILNVFSPLNEKEFKRVSSKYVIKVIPNLHHLQELKEKLYDNVYYRLNEVKLKSFKLQEEILLKYQVEVDNPIDMFMMTPYFYKSPKRNVTFENMRMTMDFKILVYIVQE